MWLGKGLTRLMKEVGRRGEPGLEGETDTVDAHILTMLRAKIVKYM